MARPSNRLTAVKVRSSQAPGYYADGGGLYLQVSPTGSKSWVFRYQRHGKRRELGIGGLLTTPLATARALAEGMRRDLGEGREPIGRREAARTAAAGRMTFDQCCDAYISAHRHGWRNPKHGDQWASTLSTYASPHFGAADVASVDTAAILRALEPIWTTKTETGSRVRGRIERVLGWATTRGYRTGENPARWRGHLEHLIAKPSKIAPVQHFRAMPFADLPEFFRAIRDTPAGRALRYTILTASRTGEVTGMDMREVRGDVWTIPANRMKAGREHRVPLTAEAAALLPEAGRPFAMSENAMLYLVQRPAPKGYGLPYTVHGFRSSFRDWAAENGWAGDVVEMALAHTIKDKTEAAYRRGDLLDRRRELMRAWADFLTKP